MGIEGRARPILREREESKPTTGPAIALLGRELDQQVNTKAAQVARRVQLRASAGISIDVEEDRRGRVIGLKGVYLTLDGETHAQIMLVGDRNGVARGMGRRVSGPVGKVSVDDDERKGIGRLHAGMFTVRGS